MRDIDELLTYSANLNILYVEDDKSFAQDSVEIFDNFFSLVHLAVDGKDALKQYQEYYQINKKYYDIVITDICMPNMNGLELTKRIYDLNPTQAIIVISAHDESHYLLEFINVGIEYFIVKPFDLKEIVEILYQTTAKIKSEDKKLQLVNNYSWDEKNSVLYHYDNVIDLTKKELMFLKILISKNGNILEIDDVKEVTVDTLNPIISRLRKKLPQNLIKSVYGVGYKLYSNSSKI